jgi:DNA-binding CsgD family transcriptional regulator
MRQKSYDDDRLIELLSEPDLTHRDIADRLGLSRRMLGYIVRGVYRKDLLPRIREANRERLRRRRPGGTTWEAVPRGEAYDDDEMVAMLAQGEKTTGEIARHFGISRDMVWRISTGRRRPDLHQRVNRIVEEARAMVHRQAVASLEALLRRHIEVGLTGTGETARKCREFVLSLFLNPTSLAQTLSAPNAPSAIQRDLATLAADRDTPPREDEGPYGPGDDEGHPARDNEGPFGPGVHDEPRYPRVRNAWTVDGPGVSRPPAGNPRVVPNVPAGYPASHETGTSGELGRVQPPPRAPG